LASILQISLGVIDFTGTVAGIYATDLYSSFMLSQSMT
jgi:hypothetical protein